MIQTEAINPFKTERLKIKPITTHLLGVENSRRRAALVLQGAPLQRRHPGLKHSIIIIIIIKTSKDLLCGLQRSPHPLHDPDETRKRGVLVAPLGVGVEVHALLLEDQLGRPRHVSQRIWLSCWLRY